MNTDREFVAASLQTGPVECEPRKDGRYLRIFTPLLAWLSGAQTTEAKARIANAAELNEAYRKCPQCGERDFRVSDRQRAQPEVYRSRTFCLKWLCLACGHRKVENVEEPE